MLLFSKIFWESFSQNQTEYSFLRILSQFPVHVGYYFLLRKEVIHPHVPVGIPCYDLTPVIDPAFDDSFLRILSQFPVHVGYYFLLRKEVIHPHVPVGIPCYDLTPVIDPAFDGLLTKALEIPASGITNSHGLTGGVYKARERIHRGMLIRDY